jgi:hypothetical protein
VPPDFCRGSRRLSVQNTLTAYLRALLKLIASVAEGLAFETLPEDTAGEFYEEANGDRSASHHKRSKQPFALLYDSPKLQIHQPMRGANSPVTKIVALLSRHAMEATPAPISA